MWILIRLLLQKQSDLGPHCLPKYLSKKSIVVVKRLPYTCFIVVPGQVH